MYGKVMSMAIAGGLLAGFLSYKHEANKDKLIPLAFSEISQIERQAAQLGIETPHMISYLAKTNDLTMKVFEAWNDSWNATTGIFSDQTDAFISELNKKIDPIYKEHKYEIPHLSVAIPSEADSVLALLKDFGDLKYELMNIRSYLEDAWKERHHNEEHPETYLTMETYIDGDGDLQTRTVIRTRWVYDWTDNWYTYNKNYGEISSQLMQSAKENFNDIKLKESFMTAKKVGEDNAEAMNESRKEQLEDGEMLSPEELMRLSGMWLYGSTLYNILMKVYPLWDNFRNNADEWQRAKVNAKNYYKRTYDYSHAEPYEFSVTEKALKTAKSLIPLLEDGLKSVQYTKEQVPTLYKKIKEIIDNQDNEGFDHENAKKEILKLNKSIYKTNSNKGFDVEPSEYGLVALWSILGVLAGAGLGLGIDYVMGGESRNIGRNRYPRYY